MVISSPGYAMQEAMHPWFDWTGAAEMDDMKPPIEERGGEFEMHGICQDLYLSQLWMALKAVIQSLCAAK